MDRPLVAVPVIAAVCGLVFVAWLASGADPTLRQVMATHFMSSADHLADGRWWTLLTAAFSHRDPIHLGFSLFVLWSFGRFFERLWGTAVFSVFYVIAAVVASAGHCLISSRLLDAPHAAGLGASGALAGLVLAGALSFPKHRIYLFGAIPLPALAAALGFVAFDLWGLFFQSRGGALAIGHGAHLGGALCGALFWATYLRSRFRRPAASDSAHIVMSRAEVEEFQRLRAKLDQEGPQSLTPKEKAFLDEIRERVMQAQSSS
jgi:membrane associated rhomboid family serine protease